MELLELPKGKKIILFDGVCNLCDAAVKYIIKYDKSDVFRFVSLQSELGQSVLKHIGIQSDYIDSIVLYEPGVAYYYKSSAALEIAKNLQGIFTVATLFRILPSGIRDLLYDYVAKNRYKWYGKKESCCVLTENSRFL
ncbi:thiol-disulfide oxidoreductase DCC family protein [Flavobacterium sp.]|jgi:predicted DCC family thiol-disulfide oxidoreductase YuxK|uniref:thiol-disulfide oxidoreductase DCC family protein n=1 Tax=Flavobacterium sp. TaxID=239 RepID=UPI0037BE7945